MKKILSVLSCFFGFHQYETLGVAKYQYSVGTWTIREINQLVKKCKCCSKVIIPEWYKKDYRLLHPYCDIHGFPASDRWHPEFPELVEKSAP